MKKAERRGRGSARTKELAGLLTFEQNLALAAKEQFGWSIAFVRQPLFLDVEIVLVNSPQTQYVLLNEDGSTSPLLNIRNDDSHAGKAL